MLTRTLTLVAALTAGLCATSAFAGDSKEIKQQAQAQQLNSDWTEILGLKGDRAEKVQKIQEEFKSEHKELTEQHQKSMQDLREDSKKDLEGVLSKEEMSQVKDMFKAHEKQVEQAMSLSAE